MDLDADLKAPRRPRGVVKRDQLVDLCRERRAGVVAYLEGYPDMLHFLKDHVPDKWPAIEMCRRTFRYVRQDIAGEEWWTVQPFSCHEVPWCTLCCRAETYRRVKETFDTFNLATPAGEEPRFIPIVQTAMVLEDGSGWGRDASRDIGKFLRVVWDTLQDAYGEGIGAVMSYQDFGERAFAKRHPHADLTLNGWRVIDGVASKTPRFDLSGGGRRRWEANFERRAARAFGDGSGRFPGSPDWKGLRIGVKSYWGILRYKMREIVDLRKLDYSKEARMVWWRDYHSPARQPFKVDEFFYGMEEYQRRLGTWQREGRKALHRRYGIVSDRLLDRTAAAIGGVPVPHGDSCPCVDCNDWDRVILDDVDRELGRPSPLL